MKKQRTAPAKSNSDGRRAKETLECCSEAGPTEAASLSNQASLHPLACLPSSSWHLPQVIHDTYLPICAHSFPKEEENGRNKEEKGRNVRFLPITSESSTETTSHSCPTTSEVRIRKTKGLEVQIPAESVDSKGSIHRRAWQWRTVHVPVLKPSRSRPAYPCPKGGARRATVSWQGCALLFELSKTRLCNPKRKSGCEEV
ncbi:hypothetical protein B0H63DRAFT_116739 [Podospora didyma]|uniref:Uncharacterized protein n=1 Tax=Podospora didyma TaxID=330526 RepID=A0AAE0NZ52_9PEZI|nr:hypothetical protein B0H63DRAFT_116739 [Podospora didyma]